MKQTQIIQKINKCKSKDIEKEELWEIEAEYFTYVIQNQIWKFYPKYEKWIKVSNDFSKIKNHFEIIN